MGIISIRRASAGTNQTRLKHHPLAVACAAAFLLAANAGYAQETTPPASTTTEAEAAAAAKAKADAEAARQDEVKQLETVQVVGIRRGIEDAIQDKKSSTSIVESVSAEDIGKLPDQSIAESISRLPGVTAQRVAGRAQVISVRGLSPDFATSLLNGRELVSTGDNRSVEFDQYPSELMASVVVYKTPDAKLVGQGLSGTLDMRTVRPLNFSESVTVFSGRYTNNSMGSAADSDADGNRFTASYIGQFADNTLGFSIGYAHLETPIQEDQVGLYEPWQRIGQGWRPGVPAAVGCPQVVVGCPFYSDGAKALRRTGYIERDGVAATVEYRPSNAWTSTFDVFYSEATQEDTANQFEVHLGGYNGGYNPGLSIANPIINENGTFVGGVASGVYPLVRGMYNKRDDKISAAGWNNEFTAGIATFNADISWSKAERDELNLENNLQRLPAPQLDTVTLDFNSDDFSTLTPGFDYSNPDQLFLSNTIYGSGYGKTPSVVDEMTSFRLEANIPTSDNSGPIASFDLGFNHADREKEKHQPEGNINLGAQGITAIGDEFQYGLVDLGFAGVGFVPSWDVPGVVDQYMVFNPNEDASYLVAKIWTVNEKVTTGWFKANLDTNWGDVGVKGNVGVQIQCVDQQSNSFYWDNTAPAGQNKRPVEAGKIYAEILPSMNLAFSFEHDQMLRVALARQLARPRLDQLRASLEFGLSNEGVPGGSGGNPTLDPWLANAFDISYEKYFNGTKGYVAAAYFYKDLRTYIYTQSREYDFSEFVNQLVDPPVPPTTNFGQFSAPFNGSGGMLQGLELTASLPLDLFWDSMEGFGVVANVSFNDSSIAIKDPASASSVGDGDISIPGLSDRTFNLTTYFERNGFEARLNWRGRSDFIGEIGNFAGERTLRYIKGESLLDAQVGYSFGGSLKGLGIQLQAQNLTNESYHTYAETKDRPLENIEWGRTYQIGVSYKF